MPDTITSTLRPQSQTARSLLMRSFEALEREQIPYCLLRGNEAFSDESNSDIDFIVPPKDLPRGVLQVLSQTTKESGATIVQWLQDAAHFIVLSIGDDRRRFLQLHPSGDFRLLHRTLYSADEILNSRRMQDGLWIPATRIEFTCLLTKRLVKRSLKRAHQVRLCELYLEDPEGCQTELLRVFPTQRVAQILAAVKSDVWDSLLDCQAQLRAELLWRLSSRKPLQLTANVLGSVGRRVVRWWRRDRGLNIVFLGVDGSGKSSALQAVRQDLEPLFSNSQRRTFPPGLRSRGPATTNSQPHEVRPRSSWSSVVRALAYWLPYYTIAHYFFARRALLRNELILHDRHLIDALVDSKRYRYGGPQWLLKAICRVLPQPDLTILIDAPADVVRQRKQEVPAEETQRQIDAYRKLIRGLHNSFTVDGSQPLASVAADVEQIIVSHLTARAIRQFSRESHP